MKTWRRTIAHVDMDAFFAAVEQRDRPELRGRPVIVGGRPQDRGVVSTASYEARTYGVRSAMPTSKALRLCPDAVLIVPDHDRYRQCSHHIHAVFRRYTEAVEPISIDEAFLDLTGKDSVAIAVGIRRDIRTELDLTASVGISYNKFLAKLASDLEKPDGLTILTPARAQALLPGLHVRALPGIGPRTEQTLAQSNIRTISDIRAADVRLLTKILGTRADSILDLALGRDERPLITSTSPQSFGEETTFPADVNDRRHLLTVLTAFAFELWQRLETEALSAQTVTVKSKYHDFTAASRTLTLSRPVADSSELIEIAATLLNRLPDRGPIRLIGLQVSTLAGRPELDQTRLPL